ncbi:hypothetical protein D3C73_690060 [compost metagenome]
MVEHDAAAGALGALLFPVAEQPGLLAQKQVEAPELLRVLPVARLVDHLPPPLGHLAIFQHPQLHLVDAGGQHPGIQGLQPRTHLLGVDEQAILVDLDHAGPTRGDIERDCAGLALLHQQGVRIPQHDPEHGRRAAAKLGRLAHQPLGIGGEIAQPVEAPLSLMLGIELLHMVLGRLAGKLAQLPFQQGGPLAEAALGRQVVAAAALLLLSQGQVQLMAHQGAIAARGRQRVVAGRL